MKKAPTLMDTLFRLSLKPNHPTGWRSNGVFREALTQARRFVLDEGMSSFLSDLSTAAFLENDAPVSEQKRLLLVDQMRLGAMLPHKTTWIEYNLTATTKRSRELLKRPSIEHMRVGNADEGLDPYLETTVVGTGKGLECPDTEGWLLQQHPQVSTAFIAHIFATGDDDEHGPVAYTFPIAYMWTTDNETVLPWKTAGWVKESNPIPGYIHLTTASEAGTGILGYKNDGVGISSNTELLIDRASTEAKNALLTEWVGVLRRMWALLSTINDTWKYTEVTNVRPQKGYVARRQYRKFLEHKTITLKLPQKVERLRLARKIVAISRRKAHSVRGHWRLDWRHPLSVLCDHEFEPTEKHLICKNCKGRKIKVLEHQRGDASLGFVTHDYAVTHD